ncbi:MAG TPA: hypothetical protein VFE13_01420 [Caulobacteraceae bacterium]|nr:hypothetical protein [Caulobacteraceae bacterium]
MNRAAFLRSLCAAVLAAGAIAAAPAQAAPRATITMHGGSAAFIVGGHWGSGTLYYRGRRFPLEIGGLGVGAIGITSYDLAGTVFHLRRVEDIEGGYAAIDASATAGLGAGILDMSNGNGVEIRARSRTAGLKLSLAPSGLVIRLKR